MGENSVLQKLISFLIRDAHTHRCPLKLRDECKYENVYGFESHFNTYHPSKIMEMEKHYITLQMELNDEEKFESRLLRLNAHEKFLMIISKTIRHIHLLLVHLKTIKSDVYKLKVSFERSNVRLEASSVMLSLHEIRSGLTPNLITFESDVLHHLFKTTTLIMKLDIGKKSGELKSKCLKDWDCAICNGQVRPTTFRCVNDHDVCYKHNLEDCLRCRENLRSKRVDLFIGPCRHCGQDFTLREVREHEKVCLHRRYLCPVQDRSKCAWYGTLDSLKLHLKAHHASNITESNVYEFTLLNENLEVSKLASMYSVNFRTVCFDCYGDLFKMLQFKDVHGNLQFGLQLLTQNNELANYKLEIVLENVNAGNNNLMVDICYDKNDKRSKRANNGLFVQVSKEDLVNLKAAGKIKCIVKVVKNV